MASRSSGRWKRSTITADRWHGRDRPTRGVMQSIPAGRWTLDADIQVTNLDVKSSGSYPAHTSAHRSPCRNKRNSTIGTLEIGPRPTLFLAKIVGEMGPRSV